MGCYLSGGLDSCALLGIASTLHSQPIEAFTIAFEEEDFDEGPIAEQMARKAGANFHPFLMSADLRADNFADAIWYAEDPHGNGNTVAKYLLSKQVRNYGLKVVLTGEGSDEIFGGYTMFRQDMVRHHSGGSTGDKESDMQAIRARNTVARFMVNGDEQPNIAAAEGALGFTPTILKAFASRAELFGPLLSEEFSHEFHGRDPNRVFLNGIDLRSLKGRQNISQSLYLWTKSMLPDILLNHLGDRMEMAHSIEGRTPFLDHRLVSAVNRMPIEMKIRGITEKYVLREAARPYITQTVYERQKHPFISPPATSGRFGQMLRDTLWSKALEDIPFFEAAAVRAAFDGLEKMSEPAQRQGLAFVLTSISSACVLHDRFGL